MRDNLVQFDQLLWPVISEGAEENGVGDGEDRSAGSQAQSQDSDGGHRETGVAAQCSQRMANVGQ